jgi:tetratricopeptide (TPR) repeat protein
MWYEDPGNEVLPVLYRITGLPLQKIQPTAVWRVPDDYGHFNSYRAQETVTSPALVTIDRAVTPGSPRDLDEITSYSRSGDYGRAIVLARRVREVNARAAGPSSRLVLEALKLEADTHKRWADFNSAAACWEAILGGDAVTTTTIEAAKALIAYRLFIRKDSSGARSICEWAMRKFPPGPDIIAIYSKYGASLIQELRYDEALASADALLQSLPAPTPEEQSYACAITELWLIKGYCHFHRKEWAKATDAFNQVIALHPWKDSQNVHKAEKWLGFVRNRKIDPYDPY